MSSSADQSRDVSTWSTSTCSKSAAAASTVRPWVPSNMIESQTAEQFAAPPGRLLGARRGRASAASRRPARHSLLQTARNSRGSSRRATRPRRRGARADRGRGDARPPSPSRPPARPSGTRWRRRSRRRRSPGTDVLEPAVVEAHARGVADPRRAAAIIASPGSTASTSTPSSERSSTSPFRSRPPSRGRRPRARLAPARRRRSRPGTPAGTS